MTATLVELDGVTIAYRDSAAGTDTATGAGPLGEVPVLLVHGMGGDGHTWDRFAHALIREGRRVIVVDLRGHGRSAHTPTYLFDEFAHDVLRLCDDLAMTRVDLVGHSLGGYAVTVSAQQRPDLVRRVVIEETPLPRRPGDPVPNLSGRLPTLPELWHAGTSLIRHPRAVLAFDRSMTKSALEQFRTPNPAWWEALPQITATMLVVHGGAGGMVDPERVADAAALIGDCTVVRFRSGHSIHRDHYREFADVVLPFLMHP